MKNSKTDKLWFQAGSGVSAPTAERLRDRMIRGQLAPGDKLPARPALAAELEVSNDSLQRAIDTLVADGFLEARRKAGTFVVARPPHLYHFGLALETMPGHQSWSFFFDSLEAAVAEINATGPVRWSVYRGIGMPGESEGIRRLRRDVQARRLAGVATALYLHESLDSLPLAAAGVPVVPLMGGAGPGHMVSPRTQGATEDFMAQAVHALVAAGRQRIAVLTLAKHGDGATAAVRQAFHRHNLPWRPEWLQGISPLGPEWGENLLHLLFKRDGRELPDGLIVSDDNLVPAVWAGLQRTGTRVPDEVKVVAHYNFPSPVALAAPFNWLGYDNRQLLLLAMRTLCAAATAAAPAALPRLPQLWQPELETPAQFQQRLATFCDHELAPAAGGCRRLA